MAAKVPLGLPRPAGFYLALGGKAWSRLNPANYQHKNGSPMNGTAICGERVVIVEVQSGHVNLRTGHISSTDSGHISADNRNETVVWGDRRFHPIRDTADEAHEKSFRVDDIHLLKEQEAQSLKDPDTAQTWFGAIYQDRLVTRIQRALQRFERKTHEPDPIAATGTADGA